jgi:cell division protein FtsN
MSRKEVAMRKKHMVLVALTVLFGLVGGSYMMEKHKGNAATDEHSG